jgi:hypothetical protein
MATPVLVLADSRRCGMLRSFYAVLMLLVWAASAPAAVIGMELNSWELEACIWKATHVVLVVVEDRIDGRVEVLESWAGDLRKGDLLEPPAFVAAQASLASRIFLPGMVGARFVRATCISPTRMVLFLKHRTAAEIARQREQETVSKRVLAKLG